MGAGARHGLRALTRQYDVVVVGAGPAGAAAALTLARAGAAVAMLAPEPRPGWRIGESLPPLARPLLARLGVADLLGGGAHLPCPGYRSAWGGDTVGGVDFLLDPHGSGWNLDRNAFDAALSAAACEAGAHRLPVRATALRQESPTWTVEAAGGVHLSCRHLIDATGRACWLGRRLGAGRRHLDRLVAFAGVLRSGDDVEPSVLVESTPWGWWHTAPRPGGASTVMAVTDADLAVDAGLHRPAGWSAQLSATGYVRRRVHAGADPPRLRGLTASSTVTTPAAGAGWAAVGDAALTTDPLASGGLLTALGTGIAAAQAITLDAVGDGAALPAYAERVARAATELRSRHRAVHLREQRWDAPFWRRRQAPL